jgi:glutathione synthase/RimK-type ligase-like ATP-grasp enzyme
MAGPISVSAIAEAAVRVAPRPGNLVQGVLPLTWAVDDVVRTVGTAFERDASSAVQLALESPAVLRPRVVIVGIGRTPPKTTQSLIEEAAKRGMVPGEDIIATRYADLRVGADRGFVRMAEGTGADGMVLAGQGRETLFLFRGGGNLTDGHLSKIAAIQSVDGATALTDLSFIRTAGSKAITYDKLKAAGLALADTIPVHGVDESIAAFDQITGRFGADVAVLKKVNSLGGKDVHFVKSHDEIRAVIAKDPDADFVMQEFLPHAKDQDVRVHIVWDGVKRDFEIANAYVRNRNAFQLTPNLANGGYPTNYVLSPWEQEQALESARVLAAGSNHPPLHVGLDFFPRAPITASTVERNQALQQAVADGSMTAEVARALSKDTVVIGEAASSAGTKGTELVLGNGINPVTSRMVDEIVRVREHGITPFAQPEARRQVVDGARSISPA